MKPTVDTLTEEFTRLIGPEAFAKAEAAIAAAKAAAEATAKAAAEKAAAAAAAAKAAAEKAAAEKAAAAAAGPAPADSVTPNPRSLERGHVAALETARLATGTPAATPSPAPAPRPAVAAAAAPAAPRPAVAPAAARPAPAAASAPAAPRPAPAPAAPAAPLPTLPVQVVSHAAKGYNFDAAVAPDQVVEAARVLDRAGFGLDTITGVDWMAQNEMEVVYDYFHPTEALRVVVRTRVPRATPEVPTITAVFPGANWHERETHDFFGIRFTGHPNLKPFLLPEDADFHPLRKDYQ